MFSLKRKPQPSVELTPTYKTRVHNFWMWYSQQADRFYQTIENEKASELAGEVSEHVDRLLPGAAWEFCANPSGPGHAFVLSGEGNLNVQLLTQFWLLHAPTIAGWTFFPSRQPDALGKSQLEIDNREFLPTAFWLVPR